jgi:hypothetical protein
MALEAVGLGNPCQVPILTAVPILLPLRPAATRSPSICQSHGRLLHGQAAALSAWLLITPVLLLPATAVSAHAQSAPSAVERHARTTAFETASQPLEATVAKGLWVTIADQTVAQRFAVMDSRAYIDGGERAYAQLRAETERGERENARLRVEQRAQARVIARQRTAVLLGSVILLVAGAVVGLLLRVIGKERARQAALAHRNAELHAALGEVRALSGLIPICSSCKKVRDHDGDWEAVETYITSRSDAVFSHSICQSCGPRLYGEHWPEEPADEADPERIGARTANPAPATR